MMENLHELLEGTHQPGLNELRQSLDELFGARGACRVLAQQRLCSRVYRVRLRMDGGGVCSVVIKRLDPLVAQRNQFVMKQWLPAIGLAESAPALLAVAAERHGLCVWHVYEDLGDCGLDANAPDRERIKTVVSLIAKIHTRFAGHPLLPECRMHGGDLGLPFFTANVRDAIRGLESLGAPAIDLTPAQVAVRESLLARLYRLLDEEPKRALALLEAGGPETLLHGDLWTTNMFVTDTAHGLEARLIDWDHAGVGPVSYDLSTLLLRFPADDRPWILDLYRAAVAQSGWRLPDVDKLNLLFETAECARIANRVIWPAAALLREHAEWGFDALAETAQWFDELRLVIIEAARERVGTPV
jgi:hypothetical protein